MKILLDTHILLWAIDTPEKISSDKLGYIKDLSNILYVSSVNIAEISIKASIGKLSITANLLEAVKEAGFELTDFKPKEAVLLRDLPFHHKDPFDRMLIAQSIMNDYPILTDDEKFSFYECKVL
jgi:PIN domain nuclease of toxin-antitoxin system